MPFHARMLSSIQVLALKQFLKLYQIAFFRPLFLIELPRRMASTSGEKRKSDEDRDDDDAAKKQKTEEPESTYGRLCFI